ncbi:MAG: nuclear transport factor 2 family protein [Saprospiraceae bacterium]
MKLKLISLALCLSFGAMTAQAQKKSSSKAMQEKNKQIVTKAYQRIFGDLDTTAVDEFISTNFIQHNPTIADGQAGVKALVQMLASKGVSKQKIEFKHIVAQDDIVILHTRYEMAGKEWRFIDIYRIKIGKIAEHWDAMMAMPDKRANKNPMF